MMGCMENRKQIRVLIGSNGGLTGVYLAKSLKRFDNVVLLGADSSANSIGKFFVSRQYEIPGAKHDNFVECLIKILNDENIDVYLPTHSAETKVIAENGDIIRKSTKANFMVSPTETFNALNDKVSANINLKDIGVPVPTMIAGKPTNYPVFMKRRTGSGSNGACVIDNELLYTAYARSENVAFFELVKGREYTVDCLFNQNGELLGYNPRVRVKTLGGAVSVTQNDYAFDIKPYLVQIASRWEFRGCVNFQYIIRDNIPYFIDVNLRYPSGGLPLTVESGIDIPGNMLKLLLGENVSPQACKVTNKNLTMYRYFEEIFE